MIARCYHPWSSQLRRHRSKIPPRSSPSPSCNIDASSERPDRIGIGDRRRQTRRRNPQRQPTARPLHPSRAASARPAPGRSRSSAFRHDSTIHPSSVRRRANFVDFSERAAASRPLSERVGCWRGCHRWGRGRRGRCLGKSTIRTAPTGGAESSRSRPPF